MSEDIEPYDTRRWWIIFYLGGHLRFLGVAIVRGSTDAAAVEDAERRGIQPSPPPGQQLVIGAEMLQLGQVPPEEFRNRLLSVDEWAASRAPR